MIKSSLHQKFLNYSPLWMCYLMTPYYYKAKPTMMVFTCKINPRDSNMCLFLICQHKFLTHKMKFMTKNLLKHKTRKMIIIGYKKSIK